MTLSETAHDRIRHDIVTGTLGPEHPLRMDALKRRYGIGHTPLREALNRLLSERIVVGTPLRGFVVAPMSSDEMWDVIETRIHVETRALALSIERGDDGWEAAIVSAGHALSRQATRMKEGQKADSAEKKVLENRHRVFHMALIGACRSEWLLDFAAKLYVSAERYRWVTLSEPSGGVLSRDVDAEHRALAEAVIGRDVSRAVPLLERHYRDTGTLIEKLMRAPDTETSAAASGHHRATCRNP